MPRGVKKKSYENLTATNIKHVIGLLDAEQPITKKEACSILNISYNTTRLKSIIEEYIADTEYRNKRKAANRGKPATAAEITHVIEHFLEGSPVSDISKRLYRSPGFVKAIIDRTGVPEKRTGEQNTGRESSNLFLPEECVKAEFATGEIAWSTKYDQAAEVIQEETAFNYEEKYGAKCYRIYVHEMVEWNSEMYVSGWQGEIKGGFYANALAYDLGSLQHLNAYGIDLSGLT